MPLARSLLAGHRAPPGCCPDQIHRIPSRRLTGKAQSVMTEDQPASMPGRPLSADSPHPPGNGLPPATSAPPEPSVPPGAVPPQAAGTTGATGTGAAGAASPEPGRHAPDRNLALELA